MSYSLHRRNSIQKNSIRLFFQMNTGASANPSEGGREKISNGRVLSPNTQAATALLALSLLAGQPVQAGGTGGGSADNTGKPPAIQVATNQAPTLPTLRAKLDTPSAQVDAQMIIVAQKLSQEIQSEVEDQGIRSVLPYVIIALANMQNGLPAKGSPGEAYNLGLFTFLNEPGNRTKWQADETVSGPIGSFFEIIQGVRKNSAGAILFGIKKRSIEPALEVAIRFRNGNAPGIIRSVATLGGLDETSIASILDTASNIRASRASSEASRASSEASRQATARYALLTEIVLGNGGFTPELKAKVRDSISSFQTNAAVYKILRGILDNEIRLLSPEQLTIIQNYKA